MIALTPLAWLKLGAAAIALGLLVWLGLIVKGWKDDATRLPLVEQERDQVIADLAHYKTDLRSAQEASNGYQTELATLRTVAARAPDSPVRLCPRARVPERREIPAAGTGSPAAAASTGDVPPQPELPRERDIGPGLFDLADRADELSAQVRGLQEYARACSGAPPDLGEVIPLAPASPNPWDDLNDKSREAASNISGARRANLRETHP
jgi:hypothetical protein